MAGGKNVEIHGRRFILGLVLLVLFHEMLLRFYLGTLQLQLLDNIALPSSSVVREETHNPEVPPRSISSSNAPPPPTTPPPTTTVPKQRTKHAVIHMGPPKTGSTTIQVNSVRNLHHLKEDGYEIPGIKTKNTNDGNQVPFANCFVPKNHSRQIIYPCTSKEYNYLLQVAKENKNLFISSEAFAFSMDGPSIKSLYEYLTPNFDTVTIVIYYRRYYDYLLSFYNFFTESRTIEKARTIENSDGCKSWLCMGWGTSLTDFLVQNMHSSFDHENRTSVVKDAHYGYSGPIVQRLNDHHYVRNNDVVEIKIMNFHDKTKDLSEGFYCDAMPYANNTCNAIRNYPRPLKANKIPYVRKYQGLVYAARKIGLIQLESDSEMDAAVLAVKKHHEQVLGLDETDLKFTCLPKEELEFLLNKSLEYERTLVPEFFKNPLGEAALRTDFEKKAKSDLCDVDAIATLKEVEWQEFFGAQFIKYCNSYDDLKRAFCDDDKRGCMVSNSNEVSKCRDHWYNYGIREGRTNYLK